MTFDNHISTICQKSSCKLNAITRIQNLLGQKEKVALLNSFVYSNFNYCPLVWHFTTNKSRLKIEKIQERCLRLQLNNYTDNYENLLTKSGNQTMEIKRLRILATEIFKTLNGLNPKFMEEIFHYSPFLTHKKRNLQVHTRKTSKYGDKCLKNLGAHMWNSLPVNMKYETSLQNFKISIKNWLGPSCKCYLCSD